MPFDEAYQRVVAAPAPVLILDTCSILDVARATERGIGNVGASLAFVGMAKTRRLHLFVPDLVPAEWAKRVEDANGKEFDRGVTAFEATCNALAALGLTPSIPLPRSLPKDLRERLRDRSKELLDSAVVLDRDPRAMSWAVDRVALNEKPTKDGGVVKDAYIVGHALALSTRLLHAAPHRKLFVSSNTKDFAKASSTEIHDQLRKHFLFAGLGYAVSLAHAAELLRAAGEMPP